MIRRVLAGLTLLLSACVATPAFAQATEPPVPPHGVAARILNGSDCPIPFHVIRDGVVGALHVVAPHSITAVHFGRGDSATVELEVLISPRACPVSASPRPAPPPLQSVSRRY